MMFGKRIVTRKEVKKKDENRRETQKHGGPVVQTAGIPLAPFKG